MVCQVNQVLRTAAVVPCLKVIGSEFGRAVDADGWQSLGRDLYLTIQVLLIYRSVSGSSQMVNRYRRQRP
jgi:hypothetical protein